METIIEKPNYYTVGQVYELVFSQLISKTTIHKLIRKGEIPSENFLQKKLIPAWWVEQQIQKAHSPQGDA